MTDLHRPHPEAENPHPINRLLADSRLFLGLRAPGSDDSERNVKAKQEAFPSFRQRMHDKEQGLFD
jgi:hypothetical protein